MSAMTGNNRSNRNLRRRWLQWRWTQLDKRRSRDWKQFDDCC